MRVWICLTAAWCALACGPDEREINCAAGVPRDPTVRVSFPASTDGEDASVQHAALPYRNGGAVQVQVRVAACGIQGAVQAEFFVVTEEEARLASGPVDAGPRSKTIALSPRFDGQGRATGELVGETFLRFPAGGLVSVGARALGVTSVAEATVVQPALFARAAAPVRLSVDRRVQFCIESTASAGSVSGEVVHADDGAQIASPFNLSLTPGPCTLSGAGAAAAQEPSIRSHAQWSLSTSAEVLFLSARLSDAPVELGQQLVPTESDQDQLTTLAITFPDQTPAAAGLLGAASHLVELHVDAERQGRPLAGLSITLTASTSVAFTPSPLITNAQGRATAYFQAPGADNSALVIFATASGASPASVVLTRP